MGDAEARVVRELEGAHMQAADELEALYERRLAIESEPAAASRAA